MNNVNIIVQELRLNHLIAPCNSCLQCQAAALIEAQQIEIKQLHTKIEQLQINGNNLSFSTYHHEDCNSFWMAACNCGISKYITAWNEVSCG